MAKRTGTSGKNTLNGTTGSDIIQGLGGDDKLYGGNGVDSLYGGSGNDLLDGGEGRDTLVGGTGADLLYGGLGNDLLVGDDTSTSASGGADTLYGGDGNDNLHGATGNDRMYGDAGRDKLYGGSGDDLLQGGAGNDDGAAQDSLFGGTGRDTLDGGSGDDLLEGGTGNDLLEGGQGVDRVVYDESVAGYSFAVVDGKLTITDIDAGNGNDGTDTLTSIESLQFADGAAPAYIVTRDGADRTIADYDPASGDQLVFVATDPDDLSFSYVKSGNTVMATVIEVAGGPSVTLEGIHLPSQAQGFESDTAGWDDVDDGWSGDVARVASGTGGIASAEGGFHAVFAQGGAPGDETGPFTRFGGYSSDWNGEWTSQVQVYLDTGWAAGEGFDFSVAANGADGNHRRDFIFHVTQDSSTGKLLVGGSNNSSFAPRQDLETLNHHEVAESGWYMLEHHFRDAGGVLAVDLNLRDAEGDLLWTETRSDPSDLIGDNVGQNRYGWFTSIDIAGGVAVDDTSIGLDQAGFLFTA